MISASEKRHGRHLRSNMAASLQIMFREEIVVLALPCFG